MKNTKTKKFLTNMVLAALTGMLFVAFFNLKNAKVSEKNIKNSPEIKADNIVISNFLDNNLKDNSSISTTQNSISLDKKSSEEFKSKKVYTSEVLKSKFKFNAVALQWKDKKPNGTNVKYKIRIFNGKNWSKWQNLNVIGIESKSGSDYKKVNSSSELVFTENGELLQYQIILSTTNSKKSPVVYEVKIVYLDSTRGPNPASEFSTEEISTISMSMPQGPRIISRAQWGANEAYRFWKPEYYAAKTFIIHHTAGSDGGENPAAVIRAIYYHSQTLGWGDIGYNYLVDPQGNIYEGRYGGDNVVGGHTLRYNYGSIGISLLGNYENERPSIEAKNAISELIAYKGWQLDIDPKGSNWLINKKVHNIIGHKDLSATACPGKYLYEQLKNIRNKAKSIYSNYPQRIYSAKFISQSAKNITIKAGAEKTVWAKFKNTGNVNWYNFAKHPVNLGTFSPQDRESKFLKNGYWISKNRPTSIDRKVVKPGEIATFSFKIKAPKKVGKYVEKFRPVAEWGAWMKAEVTWNIKVIKNTTKKVAPARYSATWIRQSPHLTLKRGQKATLWVEFKNTGNRTWKNYGKYPTRLGTAGTYGSGIVDIKSKFIDPSDWLKYNRPTAMDQKIVKPGNIARFTFKIKIPNDIENGEYKEYFRPVIENKTWMEDWGVYWLIRVR